ncbi:hypothetical protein P152DRAFT_477039 [Eremomyces bilateralis CBS 781.70]|uniref:Uncharacterized protein n=1 Tax=Eremomyces bilateralis CBS 781.70 TaxID=1392243 RepID=A0A6G1FSP3_9PEZI|nr:uncharacterized protein P152DRAFT_477039 [Eremomyces bilateralis CBS 781.70]KAF1808794.1 hypothetical protein P152DRAFT_477039 [Eremomyces bilateralis CBS 781.70]
MPLNSRHRLSSQETALPQSPSRRSSKTACPPDGDAFSYDPIHLAEWKVADLLWKKLPENLLEPIAALQHAGAAVRTGFARLDDIGIPDELAKHTASRPQSISSALPGEHQMWDHSKNNSNISSHAYKHSNASVGKKPGSLTPTPDNASPCYIPIMFDADSPFAEDPSSQLAPTISNSSGTRTASTSSTNPYTTTDSNVRPSPGSSFSTADLFYPSPSSARSSFSISLPPTRIPTSLGPGRPSTTSAKTFSNFTDADQELPRDAHTMRYLAEVRTLRGEGMVRLRHAARKVEGAWLRWQEEEGPASIGEVGKEFMGWWGEALSRVRELDVRARGLAA